MKKIILISSILVSLHAQAEVISQAEYDKLPPLEKYHTETDLGLLTCSIKFQQAQMNSKLEKPMDQDSDFRSCIKEKETLTKDLLKQSLAKLKNNKAKSALKDFHIAYIAALKGIEPGNDELQIDYNRRQTNLLSKKDEAWTRFELEK